MRINANACTFVLTVCTGDLRVQRTSAKDRHESCLSRNKTEQLPRAHKASPMAANTGHCRKKYVRRTNLLPRIHIMHLPEVSLTSLRNHVHWCKRLRDVRLRPLRLFRLGIHLIRTTSSSLLARSWKSTAKLYH